MNLESITEQLQTEPSNPSDLAEVTRWARQVRAAAKELLEHARTREAQAGGSFGAEVIEACRARLLEQRDGEAALRGDVDVLDCSLRVVRATEANGWRRKVFVDLRLEVQPFEQAE